MPTCPENPSTSNCGLSAAQWLIDEQLAVVDTYEMNPGGGNKLILDRKAQQVLEVVQVGRVYNEGLTEFAELSCLACGQCVRITEALGEQSVEIV